MIALIPCRKGSKRIPGKGLRKLGDTPLIGWTLRAAYDSEVFSKVVVSSDWAELLEYAAGYFGAETIVRPAHLATDESLDIEWIKHALGTLEFRCGCNQWDMELGQCQHHQDEDFAILRPTSPFRGPETIQRAVDTWEDIKSHYDSLRAVRRATEPGWKQWTSNELELEALDGFTVLDTRPGHDHYEIEPLTSAAAKKHLHSRPTQSLTPCYIQTAGLEMCWTKTVLEKNSIAGDRVAGFLMEGPEALDLNDETDWEQAEALLESINAPSA